MLILPIKRYEVVAGAEIVCGLEIMRLFLLSLISLSLSIHIFNSDIYVVPVRSGAFAIVQFLFFGTHDFSQAFQLTSRLGRLVAELTTLKFNSSPLRKWWLVQTT